MKRVLLIVCAPALLLAGRVSPEVAPPQEVNDADGDGYPDAAELSSREDRAAFLEWFALVAEAQAFAPDARWDTGQRDCAGLLRFAYRSALEAHDRTWLAHAPMVLGFAPDVQRFHVPDVPVLGDRLFRVGSGPFRAERLAQDFSQTATAERLILGSARHLTAHERPERGDVLLFRSSERGVTHAMVYLGHDRVVYDIGAGPEHPDAVRVTTLAELGRHPDPLWHPVTENPAFAGFYRWRIVGSGAGP